VLLPFSVSDADDGNADVFSRLEGNDSPAAATRLNDADAVEAAVFARRLDGAETENWELVAWDEVEQSENCPKVDLSTMVRDILPETKDHGADRGIGLVWCVVGPRRSWKSLSGRSA
jgi:hypothetical protein